MPTPDCKLERVIIRGSREGIEVLCKDESKGRSGIKIIFDSNTAGNDEAALAEKVASQHVQRTGHAIQLREYLPVGFSSVCKLE
jgi:hypothetical protein